MISMLGCIFNKRSDTRFMHIIIIKIKLMFFGLMTKYYFINDKKFYSNIQDKFKKNSRKISDCFNIK